jgi:hypothetical protein
MFPMDGLEGGGFPIRTHPVKERCKARRVEQSERGCGEAQNNKTQYFYDLNRWQEGRTRSLSPEERRHICVLNKSYSAPAALPRLVLHRIDGLSVARRAIVVPIRLWAAPRTREYGADGPVECSINQR